MSWFGRLFGTKKAVDDVLDKDNGLLTQFGNWVGGFSYTSEEQAEHNQSIREWSVEYLRALEPFKVMQRWIVTIIIAIWALWAVNLLVGAWLEATLAGFKIVGTLMEVALAPFMWVPISSAVGLYLAGGVRAGFNKMKEKK